MFLLFDIPLVIQETLHGNRPDVTGKKVNLINNPSVSKVLKEERYVKKINFFVDGEYNKAIINKLSI